MLSCVLFQALLVSTASLPEDFADEHAFLQLQSDISTSKPLEFSDAATPLLIKAMPLAWLHFPKCGTSFINSLAHLPGVCPSIEKDFLMTDTGIHGINRIDGTPGSPAGASLADVSNHGVSDHKVAVPCPTTEILCPGSFYVPKYCYHPTYMGNDIKYNEGYKQHSVGMFRQPEQLIVSAFFYKWGWMYFREAMQLNIAKADVVEYAKFFAGMQTKMLTRVGDLVVDGEEWIEGSWFYGAITDAEAALARERVKEAFVFVGITDQWDLSMCLLHAMFGGTCRSTDFYNSRPGVLDNSSSEEYDTSVLNGFVDAHDGRVYADALEVFDQNLQKYGVSLESCKQCWLDAVTHGQN